MKSRVMFWAKFLMYFFNERCGRCHHFLNEPSVPLSLNDPTAAAPNKRWRVRWHGTDFKEEISSLTSSFIGQVLELVRGVRLRGSHRCCSAGASGRTTWLDWLNFDAPQELFMALSSGRVLRAPPWPRGILMVLNTRGVRSGDRRACSTPGLRDIAG